MKLSESVKKFSLGVAIAIFVAMVLFPAKIKDLITSTNLNGQPAVTSVIVPHFDLAAPSRQKFLANIALGTSPEKIILLSVNHYNSSSANIVTTDSVSKFLDATSSPDPKLIEDFIASKIGAVENGAFLNEQGIKNVLPDIAQVFPSKPTTSFIVKDTTSKEDIQKFYGFLKSNCAGCLFVYSIDFSHYNPNSLARVHDSFSLQALAEKDSDKAFLAETDSPQLMYMAAFQAKENNLNFNLFENKNSGELAGADDIETTSYFIGDYSKSLSIQKSVASTSFIFAGDLMLDRYVNHKFQNDLTAIFSDLGKRVFWGEDVSFLNFEGPISPEPIVDDISVDNLIFNFPPSSGEVLKFLHINGASLGNNHSGNAGATGLQATRKILDNLGVGYVGEQTKAGVIRYNASIPVSIISLNLLSSPDTSIVEMIKAEKVAGNFVIVFPHWGNEYQQKHNSSQAKSAALWIKNGADMIVGSHPHVTQDFEIIDGKPVIYSLGNFVFDQGFSRETQEGLILAGQIFADKIELTFLPTKQVSLKPQLMTGAEKSEKIKTVLDLEQQSGFKKLRSDTILINR